MGGLPRPDVPPGPRRELVDALHDLHHRAGWPSLRTLAREAGCSHTTVSHAFSSPRLPSWGTLELLVEAMGGDTAAFHDLWLAASAPEEGPPPTTARIAGRGEELAAVRRHLETGSGLLLVTGEAGIGKTRLVTTAATTADAFVATGSCLPLSTEVPLLPVSDVLQAVHAVDGGQWVKDALAGTAPYVAGSLRHLLPELGSEAPVPDPADEWARHRLFSAVAAILAGLADLRPFAVLVEDLHWSDTTTLDLLEHLVARGPGVRVVGTWRLDDQNLGPENLDWFPRIRRLPAVATLSLTPLSRDDTREQLALLTGQVPATDLVASIHRRTQGHPLFTEQLAAHAGTDRPLPSLLADLLDARLGELTGSAWSVSRALGVADRPLPSNLLATITGLTEADLAAVLHDLDARRLLAPSRGEEVALRHPLLAEAIRRRLVAGEAGEAHAAVARALASTPDAEPAEIAVHWQAAGDREQELAWRIRAARMARERFALRHEAEQWSRALELWPDGTVEVGDPPVRRNQALASVMDLVGGIGRDRAAMLAADSLTLVPELPGHEGAELLHHVGFYFAEVGDTELGLELLERAIAIYDRAPPSEGHVRALYGMELALRGTGRHQEAAAAVARGVEVSAELGDRRWFRHMLMEQAWYDARAGDVGTALARAREASEVAITGPDPRGEARLAAEYTDLLLLVAGDVEDVVAAGNRGLAAADAFDLDIYTVRVTRINMAQAMWRAGQVRRAARFVEPYTDEPPAADSWVLHLERVRLDMLQGRVEAAVAGADELRTMPANWLNERIELVECLAGVALWTGRPESVTELVVPLVEEAVSTEASGDLGPTLTLAARAAAECPTPRGWLGRLTAWHESCLVDPFASRPVPADSRAWAATWTAELSRLRDRQSVDLWLTAASEWDRLPRPHDAAYCRWRAAQVALDRGERGLATKLLRRAARDAREHVPLSEAIGSTS